MVIGIEFLSGIFIGLILGFCLSLLFKNRNDQGSKIKELEAEHEKYHKQVDDHFVNTAVLLNGLNDQYRDVYRHIANGAGELCSEEAKSLHIDLEGSTLLQKPGVTSPTTEVPEPVNINKPSESDEAVVDASQVASSAVNKQTGDELPLATEVEISAEIVKEIKSKSKKDDS